MKSCSPCTETTLFMAMHVLASVSSAQITQHTPDLALSHTIMCLHLVSQGRFSAGSPGRLLALEQEVEDDEGQHQLHHHIPMVVDEVLGVQLPPGPAYPHFKSKMMSHSSRGPRHQFKSAGKRVPDLHDTGCRQYR